MRARIRKAFTLVEILIVVVILGILAAIVVPQFTNAADEAQVGNVQTQLQTIRNQIELYRAQHSGDVPPSFDDGTWDDLVGPQYLKTAPINPRNGNSAIGTGTDHTGGADTDGWVWDAATNSMFAKGFNEQTKQWE